jgi:hypothetical protein
MIRDCLEARNAGDDKLRLPTEAIHGSDAELIGVTEDVVINCLRYVGR